MPPTDYLTSAGIESCLVWLSTTYPGFTSLVTLPETSAAGHQVIRALRIRAGSSDRNGVLLVGGTHARELINPDLLAGLALKLCWAYANNTGLTFGPKAYSATEVRLLVEGLDIFILPLLNPDGRDHVQSPTGYKWWRKNRSFNADGSRGTDLNRNYDFLWQWAIGNTSTVPSSDTYRGSAPFSEPETRNVRWLLDTQPQIVCFADVHSYSELVLHPWGDDNNQTTDPFQNFRNPAWDGLRGAPGSGYAEYIPSADQTRFVEMGAGVRDAIAAVRGRVYTLEQGFDLYGTSGVSADYAYSRFFQPGGVRKVWGFVIETNRPGPGGDQQYGFQPPYADALQVMDEVQSGLIQFMLSGLCVVREVGKAVLPDEVLEAIGRFRDTEMMDSPRGRGWVEMLELHGDEVLSLLSEDRRAWQVAEEILAEAARFVLDREADAPPRLERALVDRIERLAARVEKRASPGLQKTIVNLRQDLRQAIGKSAREAMY